MPRKRKGGFDKEDPFVSLSKMMNSGSTPAKQQPGRKVRMSPAGRVRAGSVGVSSTKRHKRRVEQKRAGRY